MEIHIDSLEVYGYHGVLPEEKTLGQMFVFDLRLSMKECGGVVSDDVVDTIDYTEVIDVVTEVAGCESFDLLRLSRPAPSLEPCWRGSRWIRSGCGSPSLIHLSVCAARRGRVSGAATDRPGARNP